MPPNGDSRGMLESARRLWDNGLSLAQNRLELFGVELEEQKLRLLRVLLLAAAGVILGNLALVVLTLTVVVLAGPEARLPVLLVLSVLYVVGTTTTFLVLRRELRTAPRPFKDTLEEFRRDREWLTSSPSNNSKPDDAN
jgi:uncharacterized membrane protein YqjE